MTKTRRSRRVLAGMLAVAMVFSTAPASLFNGGFLAGTAITASADETEIPQSGENQYMKYTIGDGGYGFDVRGKNGANEIQTTFANGGYRTHMQVDGNAIMNFGEFAYGKQYTSDGVVADITAQLYGKTVYIIYTLTNTNSETKTVKIGSCADTQIASNDSAPCSFTEKGIKMIDGGGSNEFTLMPGNGNFTTRWYGYYGDATANVFNNREDPSVYSQDSGIAWSWTIEIPAGETVIKKAKLSAGQVGIVQMSYDANGGTGEMEPIVDIPETEITLNTNSFVKEGYIFKGWDTDSAGETVVYADGASYVLTDEDTTLYAVWEKIIKVEPQATAVSLTYDGNVKDLITEGEVTEGKLVYAMGDNDEASPESDTYSENIPRFAKAGTYYVWYKVVTDDNQDSTKPVCIVVTIDKTDPNFTVTTENELTYTGNEQDLLTKGSCNDGSIVYALGTDATTTPDEDAYSENVPSAVNAGKYFVWYKIIGDENHNNTTPVCIEAEIAKADPVFTAPTANELTEDETVQDLITTNDCDGGKMLYALGTDATTTPDEDAFSDEIPTADESGTYYVWYKIIGDENHNDVAPTCVPVTVAEPDWLIGDVNNDGKINVADVAKAAAHVKGKRLLSKGAFKRADVNFDGTVDVTDIVQIAAHVKLKRMIVQKKDLS